MLTESVFHAVVAGAKGSVRQSVLNYGNIVKPFCQSTDLFGFLAKNRSVYGGVCEALCCHWMVYHAHEDSLWNHLSDTRSAILYSIAKLQRAGGLAAEQGLGKRMSGQDVISEAWMRENGVVPIHQRLKLMGGNIATTTMTRGSSGRGTTDPSVLAAAIVSGHTGGGAYRKIGVWGLGGHAMAAWVGQDVVFFDPNFGEFWFESPIEFSAWFPHYWSKSKYSVGLKSGYGIRAYGRKA